VAEKGGGKGAAAPVMGGGGLAPPKIICGCIRDTLIEQSRWRYSNSSHGILRKAVWQAFVCSFNKEI